MKKVYLPKKIKAQLINVIKKSDNLHDFVRLITKEERIDRRPKIRQVYGGINRSSYI